MFTDPKIAQAWVPPLYVHRVLAHIMEHMETRGGVVPDKTEPVTGWRLLDDRGSSGNYLIRFEPELTAKQVRAIVGKDITVTMENL